MASIYKQPGSAVWWVSYYQNGRRVRESLDTRDERIAKKKLRRIEAELVTGELEERCPYRKSHPLRFRRRARAWINRLGRAGEVRAGTDNDGRGVFPA